MSTTKSIPRNRTRTIDRRAGVHLTWDNYLGSHAEGDWPATVGSYQEMRDVVTPDFFERLKRKEILMNPMLSIKSSKTSHTIAFPKYATEPWITPKRWAEYGGEVGLLCTGSASTRPWEDPTLVSGIFSDSEVYSLKTEVATRCLSQIARGDTNNWENMAEIEQTVSMLRKPLGSWFKFSRKAKIATAAMSAANAWLAYRYGVRPLISSVDAVLKNLAKGLTQSSVATTRTQGVITRKLDDVITTPSSWHGEAKFTVARSRMSTIQVRAVSIDEIRWDLLTLSGLSPKDMVTLPWELVPFSFVADWFVNVGDYLGAMTQSLSPSSLGQCLSVKNIVSERRETTSATSWAPASVEVLTEGKGVQTTEIQITNRSPGLPVPSLQIKTNFRLNELTRMADAVALVGQQILQNFTNRR